MSLYVVGVDVGGTNARVAAVGEKGVLLTPVHEAPSRGQEGSEATAQAVARLIQDVSESLGKAPEAVGLAVPGHVEGLTVRWAPNLGHYDAEGFHPWRDVPFGERIKDLVKAPVVMGNDANLSAFGEYWYGAGKGKARSLVMITVGTGIGGGVVLHPGSVIPSMMKPAVLIGGNGGGAELGHTVIVHNGEPCGCGAKGCLEAYCKKDAIIARGLRAMQDPDSSILRELTDNQPQNLTPLVLFQSAERGDPGAQKVWRETGTYLGIGLGNFINLFAPEIIAVGGNIARAGEWLLSPARESAATVAIPTLLRDTRIVQAERIQDAGILGSAALAWEALS